MEELQKAIRSGRAEWVTGELDRLLKEGRKPRELLDEMIEVVRQVGEAFSLGEAFIPEMLIAAKAMQAGAEFLAPRLAVSEMRKLGKLAIGTVFGDLHDVGKNLVSLVFQGNGFEVIDLGIDLPIDKVVRAYEVEKPDLIGLSALLTTTMSAMAQTVHALKEKHPKARVIVGGAPVTKEFAERIGADGYAPDAAQAVELARRLLGI
jgi:5-methyltetrahydrofolate--homocysteine methyltransferase